MKLRQKRLVLVLLGLSLVSVGTWVILRTFNKNMVFFYTPTQVLAGESPQSRSFRLGGLVAEQSLDRSAGNGSIRFIVTDTVKSVEVNYRGILPDLFKEGKGVVVQGKLGSEGVMVAEEVLAKHDENYMPPEAAYAMKKAQETKAKLQNNSKK